MGVRNTDIDKEFLADLHSISAHTRVHICLKHKRICTRNPDKIISLQRLCERELACNMVEPRTVLQVLEFADAAGSKMLRAHCLGVGCPLHCLPVFANSCASFNLSEIDIAIFSSTALALP